MSSSENNWTGHIDGTSEFARKRPEFPMDVFEYWSLCQGQAQPLRPDTLTEVKWYFEEIQRRYPGLKGQEREYEDKEQTTQRTIDQTMIVLELCGLAPSSHEIIQQAERCRPYSDKLAAIGLPLEVPKGIINLPLMDQPTRESLDRDWYNLELSLHLRERIAAKVEEAARLQGQLSYSELENLRKSTGHFIARNTPKEQRRIPEIHAYIPALTQLRLIEAKDLLGKRPLRRVEDTLRLIIAQQEDIDLSPPPSEPSVE